MPGVIFGSPCRPQTQPYGSQIHARSGARPPRLARTDCCSRLRSAFMRFAYLRVRVANMTLSTRVRAVPNHPAIIDGSGRECISRGPAARRPRRGVLDAAPAARLIYGTRREAAAHRSSYPCQTRIALAISQVTRCSGGGAPRDDDPLEPGGLAAVLAPDVSARPTAYPRASTGSDPPHGERESHMGRGAHRQ